jgi:RimJ/RimL family protein N-acetyltransferase
LLRIGENPLSVVVLETRRLLLRPFQESDLDDYARICADPEVMRYIGAGKPLSRDDAWRSMAFFLGHWQLRGYGMWAAEDKETRTLIGRIGLHRPEGWPAFEVGWLIDRARWGEGLATEGGTGAVQFAFGLLDWPHISSLIHPANRASIRVAEKLGMTRERTHDLSGVEVVIYGRGRLPAPTVRQ